VDRAPDASEKRHDRFARQGDKDMTQEKPDPVPPRLLSPEQLDPFRAAPMSPDFDLQADEAKWQDLGDRIKAALPLDPASPEAQALLDEWRALNTPSLAAATPEMPTGIRAMAERMADWQGEGDLGFDAEIRRFHRDAAKARAMQEQQQQQQ
jgi:hypothetical protein